MSQKFVVVIGLELFRNSYLKARLKGYLLKHAEDLFDFCGFDAGNVAESNGPKKAVSITSDLPICVKFGIHGLLELGPDVWREVIYFFLDGHGVGDGLHWVFQFFEIVSGNL